MQRPSARAGFTLGTVGALLYVAGFTVIPYASKAGSAPGSSTLFGEFHLFSGVPVGIWLSLMAHFLGIAVIVLVISIAGLKGDRFGRCAVALVGASSIWFLQVLEELLYLPRFPILLSWPGARAMDLGICCAFAGGIIALLGLRATHPDPGEVGPPADPAPGTAGFILGLSGALLYVVVSFLPFERPSLLALRGLALTPSDVARATQAHTLASGLVGQGPIGVIHGVPHVYGAAVIVGLVAFGGLVRARQDRWAAALLGAAAAWAVDVPGQLFNDDRVHLIGLWAAQLAICLALVGGIVAVTRHRGSSAVEPMVAAEAAPPG